MKTQLFMTFVFSLVFSAQPSQASEFKKSTTCDVPGRTDLVLYSEFTVGQDNWCVAYYQTGNDFTVVSQGQVVTGKTDSEGKNLAGRPFPGGRAFSPRALEDAAIASLESQKTIEGATVKGSMYVSYHGRGKEEVLFATIPGLKNSSVLIPTYERTSSIDLVGYLGSFIEYNIQIPISALSGLRAAAYANLTQQELSIDSCRDLYDVMSETPQGMSGLKSGDYVISQCSPTQCEVKKVGAPAGVLLKGSVVTQSLFPKLQSTTRTFRIRALQGAYDEIDCEFYGK